MDSFIAIALFAICFLGTAQGLVCKMGTKEPQFDGQYFATCPYACIKTDYHESYKMAGPRLSYNVSTGGCADEAKCANTDPICADLYNTKIFYLYKRIFSITYTNCRSQCCFTDLCNAPGPEDNIHVDKQAVLNETDVQPEANTNWVSNFLKPLARPTKRPKQIN